MYIAILGAGFFLALGLGYGFKKTWLLFLAIIFLCGMSILLMANNPISTLQSWVWLCIIPLGAIPILFNVISNLLPKRNAIQTDSDTEDDLWEEDEETGYQKSLEKYNKAYEPYKNIYKKKKQGVDLLK